MVNQIMVDQVTSRAPYLFGPLTRLGVMVAAGAGVLDQAVKTWLLFVFHLPARGSVALGPFVDLVLIWNTGISYGLFQQPGLLGQWLLLAVKAIAVALGLIIGGAAGNAIDRMVYGAVADFVLLHLTTARWRFEWYVFNLADAAIVAGVIGILYDSFFGRKAQKAP